MRPGPRKGGGQDQWRGNLTSAPDITGGPGQGTKEGGLDRKKGVGGLIPEIKAGDQDQGTDLTNTKNTNGNLEVNLNKFMC